MLNDQVRRSAVQSALAKVRQRLGGAGASEVAARRVLQAVGCTKPGDPSPAELVR